MLLKKITVCGFKSFADRVSFNFVRRISGIVGPNGSGKSNVIDAVRWVMGEQNTRLLRGEQATDVIFAGAAKRKALGMAEVSLIFDNSAGTINIPEYSHITEISLTRRIYLDGQREYLINKNPCRLKDIVDFFTVSGLGSKTYSMIQQGQVERVLNAGPRDIREIIEEAAGTIIFKKRKAETNKKLENTTANLQRVDDLATELHERKKSLATQVAAAKKHQGLSNDYDTVQKQIIAQQYHTTRTKLDAIEADLRQETKAEMHAYRELTACQQRRNALQRELNEHDPQLTALENELHSLQDNSHELEKALVKTDLKKENAQQRLQELSRDIEEDEEESGNVERELAKLQQEHNVLQEKIATIEAELEKHAAKMQQLDAHAADTVLKEEEFNDEIARQHKLHSERAVTLKLLLHSEEKAARTREDLQTQLTARDNTCATLAKQEQQLRQALSARQTGLGTDLQHKQQQEAEIKKIEADSVKLGVQRDKVKETYFQSKANHDSAAAEIARQRDRFCGYDDQHHLGLLSDYLAFNAYTQELPARLRAALEQWAERVVVQDAAAFERFSRSLRGEGRVPIIILDCLPQHVDAGITTWQSKHALQPLHTYLNVKPQMTHLFEFIFVTLDLGISKTILAELPAAVTLFTPQGSWIDGNGTAMITAATGAGIISQQQSRQALQAKVGQVRDELTRLQAQLDRGEERKNAQRVEVETLTNKLNTANREVEKILLGYQAAAQKLEHEKSLLADLQAKDKALDDEITSLSTQISTDNKAQQTLEREQAELQADFTQIKAAYDNYRHQREELDQRRQQRQLQLVKINTELEAGAKVLTSRNNNRIAVQNRVLRRLAERDLLTADIEQANHDHTQQMQAIEQLVRGQERKRELLLERKQEVQKLMQELQRVEKVIVGHQKEQSSTRKSISLKSVTKGQLETTLQNINEQAANLSANKQAANLSPFDPNKQAANLSPFDPNKQAANLSPFDPNKQAANLSPFDPNKQAANLSPFDPNKQAANLSPFDPNKQAANLSPFDPNKQAANLSPFDPNKQAANLSPFDPAKYPLAKEKIATMLGRREKLRGELDALGAVNMLALEEYEKLQAREEFVNQQRQELRDSIEFLRQASAEIEASSVQRFNATFKQVAEEFAQLFPVLFPGGQAGLVLDKPDDPLNAGVEIIVQLPGKKKQNLNLFSGGEKSLTAISLIFALLKTKPAPFCFLDEVDAALDEANVARFNRVLRELAKDFQFIIVTHNRKTMETFDHLYGVTMQEPGVSKVVGVDLEKDTRFAHASPSPPQQAVS